MQQTQKSMSSEPAKTWERVNTANRIKGTSGRNLLGFFWRLFGGVPHRRLLRKINICRVRGSILLWVKNCSSNGIQRVGVNKWSLEQGEVKWERLKGLALGGAWPKIFINGLEKQEDRARGELYPGGIILCRVLFVSRRRKEIDERTELRGIVRSPKKILSNWAMNKLEDCEINAKSGSHGSLSVLHKGSAGVGWSLADFF